MLRTERRQVIDLPVVRAQVVEHQAETRGCPGCGQATTAPFPVDVTAPIQYGPGVATLAVYLHQEHLLPVERTGRVLGEVFGCPISGGTLERMVAPVRGRCGRRRRRDQAGGDRGRRSSTSTRPG